MIASTDNSLPSGAFNLGRELIALLLIIAVKLCVVVTLDENDRILRKASPTKGRRVMQEEVQATVNVAGSCVEGQGSQISQDAIQIVVVPTK